MTTTTFADLKMRKAELRNEMKAEQDANNGEINCLTLSEYQEVIRRIKNAESKLLI